MAAKLKLAIAIWLCAVPLFAQWILNSGPNAGLRFTWTNFASSASWTNVMDDYYLRTITFMNVTNGVYVPTVELVHNTFTNNLPSPDWSGVTARQFLVVFTNDTAPYMVGDVLELGQSLSSTGMVDILVYPIE